MKKIACAIFAAMALVLASASPGDAWGPRGFHHGGRVGFRGGVFIGVPLWWGLGPWWGAPYPVYTAPPTVVEQAPPVYVQPEPQPPQYWYYCQNPQGYYPYIQQCPGGWMTVVPPAVPPRGQ